MTTASSFRSTVASPLLVVFSLSSSVLLMGASQMRHCGEQLLAFVAASHQ